MNRLTYIGIFLAAIFIFTATFAPYLAPYGPVERFEVTDASGVTRDLKNDSPSAEHWFGTDSYAMDVFTRIIYGARISLFVGISVVTISGIFGMIIGAIAGFYGGWWDKFLSGYVFNVFVAFPGLRLASAIVGV